MREFCVADRRAARPATVAFDMREPRLGATAAPGLSLCVRHEPGRIA